MDEKACRKCGVVKLFDDFHKAKAAHDGRQTKCKACAHIYTVANAEAIRARSNAWYAANTEQHKANGAVWRAANQPSIKARAARYRSENREVLDAWIKAWAQRNPDKCRARSQRWREANRPATRAYAAKYRVDHPLSPEQVRALNLAYRKANPDKIRVNHAIRRARVRGAEGTHKPEDIAAIYKAQRGRCAYCKVSVKGDYHVDHIRALSRGGSNWSKNLQLTCSDCNRRKHAKDEIAYARSLGLLI